MHDNPGDNIGSSRTFPHFIRAIAQAYGDDVAVTLQGEGIADEALTFVELERQSAELARGLIARGVGKGTRVGFIHGNGPSFALMLAAITRAGGVAIPISTFVKANELVRILRQSDVAGLIVQRRLLGNDYVERLCNALPDLRDATGPELRIDRVPFLRWILSSGDALPPAIGDIATLREAAETVSEALLAEIEAEILPTDQMIEIYTSGSMALPKGVRHDHGPVMFRTHYLSEAMRFARAQQRPVMLPMFWVGGLMIILMPALAAGSVAVCSEGTSVSSRRAMGSVLPAEDLALMASAPKPWWALGMSETLGPYAYGDDFRAEGWPVCAPLDQIADGYELRVVDEMGNPVKDGEAGEIQVRGYPVSPALHKVERDLVYTADGYYRTGDMGLVEGKRVHFAGRDGDMIKSAGSNVSPAEVEMEMQALDGVHSAYVVGLPDAERGQVVVAAVVPRDGHELDFDAIQKQLRQRLSPYKVPRACLAITREEVPMLPSNKVARRQIAAMLAEKLGHTGAQAPKQA